ncbi:hypothetical protein D3C75_1262850 [compost metagenome]
MAGLMGQAFILALPVALPYLQLIEQGIEVVAQIVEFVNVGRRRSTLESAFGHCRMDDCRQVAQGPDDANEQAP